MNWASDPERIEDTQKSTEDTPKVVSGEYSKNEEYPNNSQKVELAKEIANLEPERSRITLKIRRLEKERNNLIVEEREGN